MALFRAFSLSFLTLRRKDFSPFSFSFPSRKEEVEEEKEKKRKQFSLIISFPFSFIFYSFFLFLFFWKKRKRKKKNFVFFSVSFPFLKKKIGRRGREWRGKMERERENFFALWREKEFCSDIVICQKCVFGVIFGVKLGKNIAFHPQKYNLAIKIMPKNYFWGIFGEFLGNLGERRKEKENETKEFQRWKMCKKKTQKM